MRYHLRLLVVLAICVTGMLCAYPATVNATRPAQFQAVTHPEWSRNANIYEVNIRQYSPGGTFKEFEEHLPRLKDMGVDILWLMPIHPIGELNRKGTLGPATGKRSRGELVLEALDHAEARAAVVFWFLLF